MMADQLNLKELARTVGTPLQRQGGRKQGFPRRTSTSAAPPDRASALPPPPPGYRWPPARAGLRLFGRPPVPRRRHVTPPLLNRPPSPHLSPYQLTDSTIPYPTLSAGLLRSLRSTRALWRALVVLCEDFGSHRVTRGR